MSNVACFMNIDAYGGHAGGESRERYMTVVNMQGSEGGRSFMFFCSTQERRLTHLNGRFDACGASQ